MADIKGFIEQELNNIAHSDSDELKLRILCNIYDVLSPKGYTESEIKRNIDFVIINNLSKLSKKLIKLTEGDNYET